MALSGVCSWQVEAQFSDYQTAREFYDTARKPGTFCSWHLSEEGEEDIAGDFLASDFSSFITYPSGSAIPALTDNLDPSGVVPSWVHRGGSGVVEDVDINFLGGGEAKVSVGATCWGKQLQQTLMRNVPDVLARNQTFPFSLVHLFYYQAEYRPAFLRDLADEETEAERIAQVEALGDPFRQGSALSLSLNTDRFDNSGVYTGGSPLTPASFSADRNSVSPVGRWLLVPLMTQAARNYVDERYWGIDSGQQSLLRELQRLCETAGLVFMTGLPYIIIDVPGARPARVWDLNSLGAYQASVQHLAPQSSVWVINHADDLGVETGGSGRNITLHFIDEGSVSDYGEIQTSLLSSAPRYLNDQVVPFVPGEQQTDIEPAASDEELERNPFYYSDLQLIELLQQQAFAAAVSETENFTANLDLPYRMGSRFGSDWRLGDLVRLNLGGQSLTDNALVVRQAGISINAEGEVRQQCVLGGRGDIQPQWFGQHLGAGPSAVSVRG